MSTAIEPAIQAIGAEIFRNMKGQKPSVFNKDWWSGKVMEMSMKDEAFKVEMFRFVDVFPALSNHVEVAQHLQEYFCRPEQDFPSSFQWGIARVKPDSIVAKMAAGQINKQMTGIAGKFIAGTTAAEALGQLAKLWKARMAFTLDLLGEATVSEKEALDYYDRYVEIIETLSVKTRDWKHNPQLENASWGVVPRVNVSVKVSSLYSQIDPLDFEGSLKVLVERLTPLFLMAKERGALINLDMEQHDLKDLTIALFCRILEHPELVGYEHAGIAIQAYLRSAEEDLEGLIAWAKRRGTPVTVRLIKGAYWDYETIHSQQEGWRNPVWSRKWETDACFERCTDLLLRNAAHIRLAIGSHNVRSIAHAIATSRSLGLPDSDLEFQMLYGMAEPIKAALSQMGFRLREYVPIGEMIPGMAYLVRRLLENTSNESWLRQSYADGASMEELLKNPALDAPSLSTGLEEIAPLTDHGFRNHPMLDFSHAAHRTAMLEAVQAVGGNLGGHFPLVIGGKAVETQEKLTSLCPSSGKVVGTVASATKEDARAAVASASQAFPAWSRQDAQYRAGLLVKLSRLMQRDRQRLAALMVWEVGKNFREADADVCEAIDFCEWYAREALRIATPQRLGTIPGEHNQLFYQPRGVCAVIAPWNFPLAILTGMTTAAAVTGNTVVMKPAEQSSVIAFALQQLVEEAGFPAGVINYLPGKGEVAGAELVEHPDVSLIAFTGSLEVGLHILKEASSIRPGQVSIKRVICEMGGKNAIIVDSDADLDEAVMGVLHSAFGFQGQKCSACSRVIALDSCYEEFRERLVEATRSLEIGPAYDPAFGIGPVVDEPAQKKITSYIELAKVEGRVLIQREVPGQGFFVGPTIVEDLSHDSRIVQEEIFGPVVALMRASDFDEALQMANGTRFALTGGVFSRSPLNLEKARQEFKVGNLYINRGCTGALVYRHPFGGFKMSGIGSKAGGPDYLLQFVDPRAISENTMRRGFAPVEQESQ